MGVRYNFHIPMVAKSMKWLLAVVACAGLMLVQPGVSPIWVLDPCRHAEIDADLYGQTPDGQTLPGHAEHPPHQHPGDDGWPNSEAIPLHRFTVAYAVAIYSEANRPSLLERRSEAAVIAATVFLDPPDHPPRA